MRYKGKNPRKSIHFAGRNYDIEDGRYVLIPGYGGGYVPSEPKQTRSRTLATRPSLLDEGQQAVKEAQMNAYSSALSYVNKAHTAIRSARAMQDPSYLEQARYALKAAKWQGAILQKSPYAEAHDRALVRSKISEAAKALQDEALYMSKKNPISSRVKSRHADLLSAGRYEDAAKVYKRAMKREMGEKNPEGGKSEAYAEYARYRDGVEAGYQKLVRVGLSKADRISARNARDALLDKAWDAYQATLGKKNPLSGTYAITHANPRSAPSKSVKLRFPSSSAAWEGMRKLDDAGIDAGYPSLGPATSGPHKGYYTVQVGRKNAAAAQRVLGGARSNPSALNLEATLEAQRAVKDAERVVNQANLNYFGDPTELLADIQAANVAVQKAQRLAKASGVAHLNKTVRVLAKRVKELREHALREARGAF